MPKLLSRYATPLISGLFLVSLISGIALFFHVGPVGFHGMHEWLSIVLIVPFGLHLWKNWKPLTNYLRRSPMALSLGVSLIAALLFLVPVGGTEGGGRPPQFALANRIMAGSVADVAAVLGMAPDALIEKLRTQGFTVEAPEQPLREIASNSGRSEMEVAGVLVSDR